MYARLLSAAGHRLAGGRRCTVTLPAVSLTAVALTTGGLPTRALTAKTLPTASWYATSAGSTARPSSALIVRPTATLTRLRSGACLHCSRGIL